MASHSKVNEAQEWELRTYNEYEHFINDVLRRNLKEYNAYIQKKNADLMEFVQLKNMCQFIGEHFIDTDLKTQVDIGVNFFMSAKVTDTSKILINVGLDHYIEFTLPEAVKFCEFKVRSLQNEIDVIREKSIETRAQIKLTLVHMGEEDNFIGAD